jgi:hypothetical protein
MIGLAVFLVIAGGYGALTQDAKVARYGAYAALGYVALLMLVISPWQMWRDARAAIASYRERLTSRLSFVFEPDVPPYVQVFQVATSDGVARQIKLCRIGIRNDSDLIIRRVRVVVETVDWILDGKRGATTPEQGVLVEHALNVMGIDRKSGGVNLSPGDRPTAFVDVAEQWDHPDGRPESYMSPCYATRHRTPVSLGARSKWVLGLRAEGGGTYCRTKVSIDVSASGRMEMRPYSLG